MADRTSVHFSEWLYRRGHSTPEKKYMNPDGTATSRVFKLREKDNGELSVDVKRLTTPGAAVGDKSSFMLFELANQAVLNLKLRVFHDPTTFENHGFENAAHAIIVGMHMDDEILPGLLARLSKRVIF